MSCVDYGGGSSTCTVPTSPVPTTMVSVPVPHVHELPFTGGDVVGLSIVGVLLLASGAAIIRHGRRLRV